MARKKKERAVKGVYTVFEYEDGGPMEVILPDGRMAILIDGENLYECTRTTTTTGCVRRLRNGKIELMDDNCNDVEETRTVLREDGVAPDAGRKMVFELRPMVSFG